MLDELSEEIKTNMITFSENKEQRLDFGSIFQLQHIKSQQFLAMIPDDIHNKNNNVYSLML